MKPRFSIAALLFCTLAIALPLLQGCAPAQLVRTWKNPDYRGPKFDRMMALGVATQSDVRKGFENAFVQQLDAHGAHGIASYTLIPQDGKIPPDDIAKAMKNCGADFVLVMRKIGKQSGNADLTNATGPQYSDGLGGFYTSSYADLNPPPTVEPSIYVLQAKLFSASDHQLVWTATIDMTDEHKQKKELDDLAKVVVNAMAKAGLIK